MFKWCRRIGKLVHPGDLSGLVPARLLEDIAIEALDVFCALWPRPEQRCEARSAGVESAV
jgi:hypothetical protein